MPNIPTITVWQPWATLIAESWKQFEFRSWAPPQRLWGTRIAIHAGARPVMRREMSELISKPLHPEAFRETGHRRYAVHLLQNVLTDKTRLPLSSILCTATLSVPVRNEDLAKRLGVELVNDSDRDQHTNFGWPLTDIQQLRPFVPCRGRQGLWTWSRPD